MGLQVNRQRIKHSKKPSFSLLSKAKCPKRPLHVHIRGQMLIGQNVAEHDIFGSKKIEIITIKLFGIKYIYADIFECPANFSDCLPPYVYILSVRYGRNA